MPLYLHSYSISCFAPLNFHDLINTNSNCETSMGTLRELYRIRYALTCGLLSHEDFYGIFIAMVIHFLDHSLFTRLIAAGAGKRDLEIATTEGYRDLEIAPTDAAGIATWRSLLQKGIATWRRSLSWS